jgi:hypothetical protein
MLRLIGEAALSFLSGDDQKFVHELLNDQMVLEHGQHKLVNAIDALVPPR